LKMDPDSNGHGAHWTEKHEEVKLMRSADDVVESEFGAWLNARISESQIDPTGLAARAGISHGYLSMLRSGQRLRPSPDVVDALAGALGAPTDEARHAAGHPPRSIRDLPRAGSTRRGASHSGFQAPGAAFDPDWYIHRVTEERQAISLLGTPGAPAVVWGPIHFGKTWLMRGVLKSFSETRGPGCRVVAINLRGGLGEGALDSSERLLREIGARVLAALELPEEWLDESWSSARTPSANLSALIEDRALAEGDGELVLAIDQVDELIGRSFQNDVFGLLRAWAEDAYREPWSRVRLMLAVSMNPVRLTDTLTQSPFNLTPPIKLTDLSEVDLGRLAGFYRLQYSEEEIQRLRDLVGGHPYLTRLPLWASAARGERLSVLLDEADPDNSVFGPHLQGRLNWLRQNEDLSRAVRELLTSTSVRIDPAVYYELERSGLVEREAGVPKLRYRLYKDYLESRL